MPPGMDIEAGLSINDESEDGAVFECFVLDLCDPVTLDRINIPVKGANCRHAQCFDKATHDEMVSTRATNSQNCPICNKPISGLVENPVFKELLNNAPEGALKVEYNATTKIFTVVQ